MTDEITGRHVIMNAFRTLCDTPKCVLTSTANTDVKAELERITAPGTPFDTARLVLVDFFAAYEQFVSEQQDNSCEQIRRRIEARSNRG